MVRLAEKRVSNMHPILCDTETDVQVAIESRVARIKARVAELTGNIEAARR
jgi:hypothetical protein